MVFGNSKGTMNRKIKLQGLPNEQLRQKIESGDDLDDESVSNQSLSQRTFQKNKNVSKSKISKAVQGSIKNLFDKNQLMDN